MLEARLGLLRVIRSAGVCNDKKMPLFRFIMNLKTLVLFHRPAYIPLIVGLAGLLFMGLVAQAQVTSSEGIISTVAGGIGYGGPATEARLIGPRRVTTDADGSLYIADSGNHRIRKVASDGTITTVAGTGEEGFNGDEGPATAAQLAHPRDVAMDGDGNLYIAETASHRIRKVTREGAITTAAGTGEDWFSGDGGPATAARLNRPSGLAVDGVGNLFIADSSNYRIRKVAPDGTITTVAGTGEIGFSKDGGLATAARLVGPQDVATDGGGNLFIADSLDERIRKVTPDGIITTVAGTGERGFSGDGGAATRARLGFPSGLAVDPDGNLYIAERLNQRIRKVTFPQPTVHFSIDGRGGVSLASSDGSKDLSVGYGRIESNAGPTPSGHAVWQLRVGEVMVSEAAAAATLPISRGRVYAEIDGSENTALVINNPNDSTASISFFFTDGEGNNFGNRSLFVFAGRQILAFLNGSPFNGPEFLNGTLTFDSSVPISVVAVRVLINERGEPLLTPLPVADLDSIGVEDSIRLPLFTAGGGWSSSVVLVNPTDTTLNGTVQFWSQGGAEAVVIVNDVSGSTFSYSIPPRSSQKLQVTGTDVSLALGWAEVTPTDGSDTPSGTTIISFKSGEITVSEAAVPAVPTGNAFRVFSEVSGSVFDGDVGAVDTVLGVANTLVECRYHDRRTIRIGWVIGGAYRNGFSPGERRNRCLLESVAGTGIAADTLQGRRSCVEHNTPCRRCHSSPIERAF